MAPLHPHLETYHHCNKKPLNTIKTLHRLECFRAPQLWEKNEFLYHNNKEPLNLLHNILSFLFFFAFILETSEAKKKEKRRRIKKLRKKILSGFIFFSTSFLLQRRKTKKKRRRISCLLQKARGSPYRSKRPVKKTRQKWLLIRLATVPNTRHSPEKKKLTQEHQRKRIGLCR